MKKVIVLLTLNKMMQQKSGGKHYPAKKLGWMRRIWRCLTKDGLMMRIWKRMSGHNFSSGGQYIKQQSQRPGVQ